MEVNELIKALRCCGNTDYKEPDCDNCPLRGRMCVKRMLKGAAEALEELQAQLAKVALSAQEAEKNEPLTLDELRQMDGEPVYLVNMETPYGWNDGWYLVCDDVVYSKHWEFPLWRCPGFAYRRKPKEV